MGLERKSLESAFISNSLNFWKSGKLPSTNEETFELLLFFQQRAQFDRNVYFVVRSEELMPNEQHCADHRY